MFQDITCKCPHAYRQKKHLSLDVIEEQIRRLTKFASQSIVVYAWIYRTGAVTKLSWYCEELNAILTNTAQNSGINLRLCLSARQPHFASMKANTRFL